MNKEEINQIIKPEQEKFTRKQKNSYQELRKLLLSINKDTLNEKDKFLYNYIIPFLDISSTIIHSLKNKDLQSAVSLQRNLIDKYATFHLLAINGNEEEKRFRYLLFLIDYNITQKKICELNRDYDNLLKSKGIKHNNNKIWEKQEEYINHYDNEIENIKNKINNEDLTSLITTKTLDKVNWKYKPDVGNKKYSFKDLYKKSGIPEYFSELIQIFHSGFTHSLGISLHTVILNYDYISSTVLTFQYYLECLLFRAASSYFKYHIDNYTESCDSEKMRKDLEILNSLISHNKVIL